MILHYLQIITLFPRNINHNHVIREYVVPLWLLIQEILINWVEGIFNHVIWCKEIPSTGLPYGPIITRLLATFNIDTMDEAKYSTYHRITYTALRQIKVLVKHGEIQEDSSIKEEGEDNPEEEEETKIDKVLNVCQSLVEDINKIMERDGDDYVIE